MRRIAIFLFAALLSGCGVNPVTSTPEGKRIDEILTRNFGGRPYAVVRWWPPRQDDELLRRLAEASAAGYREANAEMNKAAKSLSAAEHALRSAQEDGGEASAPEAMVQKRRNEYETARLAINSANALKNRLAELNELRFARLKFRCKDTTGVQREHDLVFVVTDGEWKVADPVTNSTLLENAEWE
jgi:hypothetical protein